MTSLVFTFGIGCFLCGYRSTGMVHMFGARINKTSVRAGRSIITSPRCCPECSWPLADLSAESPMRPDPESADKIAEVRRAKGWMA